MRDLINKVTTRLANLIKFGYVSNTSPDDKNIPFSQITYFDNKITNSVNLFPYGMSANPPANSMSVLFNICGQEENSVNFVFSSKNRFKNLKEGESIFGNESTRSYIKFAADKNIEISSAGTGDINLDAGGSINANADTSISLRAPAISIESTGLFHVDFSGISPIMHLLATDTDGNLTSSGLVNWIHSLTLTVTDDTFGGVWIEDPHPIDTWTAPLQYSLGTASITQADSKTDGYLSSADWINFNDAYSKRVDTWPTPLTFSANVIGVTTGYVIPTTTQESNWGSAYSDTSAATALDTASTIVKRDANGRTAVSLSDDNNPARLCLNHNSRLLIDTNNHMSIDWNGRVQYGMDDKPIPEMRLQIDYQNSQLWSWYKYLISFHPPVYAWADFLSLDWKQCVLYDTAGKVSLGWDGHYGNDYDEIISLDYGGRGLLDSYGNVVVDWGNYILSNADGFPILNFGNGAYSLQDEYSNTSIDFTNRLLVNGSGTALDWSGNITLGVALTLTPTATVPTPAEGMMYVDSNSGNHLYIYLNSAWHLIV
jgi:phage gp45-like